MIYILNLSSIHNTLNVAQECEVVQKVLLAATRL